jgi:hypothetical protein
MGGDKKVKIEDRKVRSEDKKTENEDNFRVQKSQKICEHKQQTQTWSDYT